MRKTFFSIFKSHVLLAFIPWIVFSNLISWSLLYASLIALVLMIACNFKELKKGFVLPWGSTLFFAFIALNAFFQFWDWAGTHVFIIINSALAAIVLLSMIIGKPFTLQYARQEVDRKYWNSPNFIKINWVLTSIWAILLIIMALPSYLLTQDQILNNWFWRYGLSILCLVIGFESNKYIPLWFKSKIK